MNAEELAKDRENRAALPEIFDRLCVAAKLVNTTMGLECLVIGRSNGITAEIPSNHLRKCFCKRLAEITGEDVDIEHMYRKCRNLEGSGTHFIYACPFDLTNIMIPVIKNGQVLSVLQMGPILTADADEILQKHALSRKNMDAGSLQELKTYLQNLPSGDIDYVIALAEMATILAGERLADEGDPIVNIDDVERQSDQEACSEVVEAALTFIEEHFTDNEISLNTVAQGVYVHPSHLSRMFSQQMNCRFRGYINKLRIDLASKLLTETNKSINDICHETGFSDQSYFVKIFKQHHGVTPSQYRKKTAYKNDPLRRDCRP